MLSYVIKRLAYFCVVMLVTATFAFLLMHLAPGDPATVMLGQDATEERLATVRHELRLDKPLYLQYFGWLGGCLRGDLGKSYYINKPVITIILERLPVTLAVATLSLVIAVFIGFPAGVIAAIYQNTVVDHVSMLIAFIGVAFPSFWLGLNLMLLFSVHLGWFPAGGYTAFSHNPLEAMRSIALPSFTLGFIQSALIARMTRGSFIDVLSQDYVRTARSKGLSEKSVILKHALRNASITIVTVVGLVYGELLGGAAILEIVYTLPGVGRLLIDEVMKRDYGVIQGVILFSALIYSAINLLTDLAYTYIDPRIKYE